MPSLRLSSLLLLLSAALIICDLSEAFPSPTPTAAVVGTSTTTACRPGKQKRCCCCSRWACLNLRGGSQNDTEDSERTVSSSSTPPPTKSSLVCHLPKMGGLVASVGNFYATSLEHHPIRTKSITAGCVFAISDWLAQRLDKGGEKKKGPRSMDWTRTTTSALVGLLYFGPAAHYWYDAIFRILPGTSLVSTLQKAALGQLIFGPSFTCIFFATSLMQAGTFSLSNWVRKIRQDLPGAWLAGVGFWPLVDLVSYSLIAPQWIPLFVNLCSLVWTIYLSLIANRGND